MNTSLLSDDYIGIVCFRYILRAEGANRSHWNKMCKHQTVCNGARTNSNDKEWNSHFQSTHNDASAIIFSFASVLRQLRVKNWKTTGEPEFWMFLSVLQDSGTSLAQTLVESMIEFAERGIIHINLLLPWLGQQIRKRDKNEKIDIVVLAHQLEMYEPTKRAQTWVVCVVTQMKNYFCQNKCILRPLISI